MQYNKDKIPGSLLLYCIPIILLSGCISTIKRDTLPPVLPESFSSHEQNPVKPNKKWWLDFNDGTLNTLIEGAFYNNYNLLSAKEHIEEAGALARQKDAELLPDLEGGVAASLIHNGQESTTSKNFTPSFSASYEIDLWGQLAAQQETALLNLETNKANFDTVLITLSAEIANTWFSLIENYLQLKLLKKQQEINRKMQEVISVQFRTGKAGIEDMLQQEQLIEAGNEDIASLNSNGRRLEFQLNTLLGKPVHSPIPALPKDLPQLAPLPATGIPADTIMKRPDVQAAYYQLEAADKNVAIAVAQRLPRLSLSASVYDSSSRFADIFNTWFINLGANLVGPLFDGGKRLAEVDRTKAAARRQYYSFGQTLLEAAIEVETNLTKEKEQQKILHSRELQLKLAADTVDHITIRYRQGAENYQRVLTALRSHQNLQRDILRSRLQQILTRISLYRAISGRIPYEPKQKENQADTILKSPIAY